MIIPLQHHHIPHAARVFVEAFSHEAFTRRWLSPSSRWQRRAFTDLVSLVLSLNLRCRQPFRTAWRNGTMAGVLFLTRPAAGSILDGIGTVLFRLPHFLRLCVRMSRAWPYRRATTPPASLRPPYWTVAAVAVSSAHRGHGIGKALIAHARELCAQDSSARGLYLFTGDQHNRVIYERWGFSLLEKRHTADLTSYHLFAPPHSNTDTPASPTD